MKASVHIAEQESRKKHATEALLKGIQKLGIRYELRAYNEAPAGDSDFAVVWGHKHRCCALARSCALPLLVVERPYFGDRNRNYSLTWNWAHRLGTRPEAGKDARPGPELEPWHQGPIGSIVVFDQVPTDVMFQEAPKNWAQRIADQARIHWRKHSYVRPHPQVERTGPLEQALRSAYMGISFTSTAAVQCIASGVPCVAINPKSMAWDVAGHTIAERIKPDREEWAHWLSYCQWSGEELEDGSALTHLLKAHDEAKEIPREEITRRSGLDGDS